MPKKEKLPPGWLKRESKTYPGKFYYFHKETRRTTWLLPADEELFQVKTTDSKESNCPNTGSSKSPMKTQRKSLSAKEKQESMVPRVVRQTYTPTSTVSGPKKILNVSVLNQRNCSLVADYSSSDGDEGSTMRKKKKNNNENKTKKTYVSLPSISERNKVQMKWKVVGPKISQPSSKLVLKVEQKTNSKDFSSSPTKPEAKPPKKVLKSKKLKEVTATSKLTCDSLESENSCLEVPQKKKVSPKKVSPKKVSPKKVSPKKDKPKKSLAKIIEAEPATNEKPKKIKSTSKKSVKRVGKKKPKSKSAPNSSNLRKLFDQKKQNNSLPEMPLDLSEPFLPLPTVVPEIQDSNLFSIVEHHDISFSDQNISTSNLFYISDNHLEDSSQPMEVDSCPDSDMIDYIVKLRKDMSNECFNTATGDLTKNFEMDTSTSIDLATQPQVTYVVVDTNALVNSGDLIVIRDICDGKYTAVGHLPYIIIPWVVMQELDVLKSRTKQKPKTAERAQKAIVFLSSYFTKKHPRVVGQTLKEAMQQNEYLVAENNDDKILQCCMQLESKYPHCKIVLYSNDVNLCNKTLINGIAAFHKASICSGLSKLSGLSTDNCDENRNKSYSQGSPQTASSFKEINKCNNDISQSTKLTPSKISLSKQIFNRQQDILKRVLGLVLETEMKAAYNEVWLKIIKVQPPWKLSDILYCFVEHWYAVFGQIYTNRNLMETKYKNLSNYFSKKNVCKNLELISSKMDEWCFVLEPLLTKNPLYKDEVKCSLESLEILQRICNAVIAEEVDVNLNLDQLLEKQSEAQEEQVKNCLHSQTVLEPSFNSEFAMNIALTKFQKVWEIFNCYCQEVERTLQNGASPETCQQVFATLQTSIPMMEIIYSQFSSCLRFPAVDIPKEVNMFTVLSEQLNTILPHLGCQDNNPLVSCVHLQTLFLNPEKREMLSNGLTQLEIMIRGLHTYQGHLVGT